MVEITATKQNIEKRMQRNEDSLRDLWDYIKHTSICIIEVLEKKRQMQQTYLMKLWQKDLQT